MKTVCVFGWEETANKIIKKQCISFFVSYLCVEICFSYKWS